MDEDRGMTAVRRPSAKRRVVAASIRQVFAIEEMHKYGINLRDFSVYLTGTEKVLQGDDTDFSEPGVEYQMATAFIKNLQILSGRDPKKPILVHMKSCGGDWDEGMSIYDAIRACPNPITILAYTHARSMSSLILQAADKRVLMPHSYFMFHEGTLGFELKSTTKAVQSYAEWDRKIISPTMLAIYAHALKHRGKRHAGWSLGRIKKMLKDKMDRKEDVYLTAEEAVEWGFADEVFGGESEHFDWRALRTKKQA